MGDEVDRSRVLERPFQYAGESVVSAVAWPGTVGSHMSRGERTEVVREWIEFFARPTQIRELTLSCRVNDTLLRALAPQTQLVRLSLRWGPYTNLAAIAGMPGLTALTLGGATALTNLTPLTALPQLTELEIENARKLTDYAPLGKIRTLTELAVGRSITGARTDADSLAFIADLPHLKQLRWDPRVATRDYSPLLALPGAEEIYVTEMKGMTPSLADLEWALPGIQAANRRRAERRIPIFGSDGEVSVMAQDVTGATVWVAPSEGEEFAFDDPYVTPELTGPIAGFTIRTLSRTARTRTERYRLRIQSPAVSEEFRAPPTEEIIAEHAFTGLAEGPLLIWDSPAPVSDDTDELKEFFAGNTEIHDRPLPLSRTVDASQMPLLRDGDFWPYFEELAGKSGSTACIRVAKRLAARDDDFVLRWTNTLSHHALALVPIIEQLISDGLIAQENKEHAISAVLAHGRHAYTDLFADASSFTGKPSSGGPDIFWIGSGAFARRHHEVGRVTTQLSEWLEERSDASVDLWENASGSWFWSARALIRIDGEIRERVILVNLNGMPDQEWATAIAAAFLSLGGTIAAGPEIGQSPAGDLRRTDVAFITRRHSTIPVDAYAARYATRAQ